MAPTGPRNARPPTGPRNKRGSTTETKPVRGGGISKRRSDRATRLDRDGDLDMDTPAATNAASHNKNGPPPTGPGRRSTRSSTNASRPAKPTSRAQEMIAKVLKGSGGNLSSRIAAGIDPSARHSRSNRPTNSANLVTLRVEGLKKSKAASNPGGGLKELEQFLIRKAESVGKLHHSRHVRIKKSQLNGDFVYITVSKEDGEEILKLNGFAFAGTTLSICEASEGTSEGLSTQTQEIKSQLTSVLERRYDISQKLLNLANLGEDTGLSQLGVFTESKPEKLFSALMAICDGLFKTAQAKRDSIVSVTLAGNNIDDVSQIMSLADTFPDLVNLDLRRNQFKDLKGLRKWSHRLRNMQTLYLNENPIEVNEPAYKAEMTKWFPKLLILSDTQVRTPEQVTAAETASRPTPIPQNGADFRDINRVGEGFMTEFLQMYDVDRKTLAAKYYDDHSTFSLSVNNRAPHSQDVQPPSWTSYIKLSRNHTRITNPPSRYQRLFTGTALIESAWQNLPPTRHPDLRSQFDKYIIDCHPISGLADLSGQSPTGVDGMIMTVHGEFEDQDVGTQNTAKRSFSRTFILGPGAPGRNPIRVVSDMLSMKVWNPLPTSAATSTPITAPPANGEVQKQQMVLELSKRTGMTPEYSKMCLDVAAWNFDQALVTFNEKKGGLPPGAFASNNA